MDWGLFWTALGALAQVMALVIMLAQWKEARQHYRSCLSLIITMLAIGFVLTSFALIFRAGAAIENGASNQEILLPLCPLALISMVFLGLILKLDLDIF